MVELAAVKSDHDIAGLVAGVNAHAGVAFFLGKLKMPRHTGQHVELARHIVGLGFDFLDANTIGLGLRDPGLDAFGGGRANAVQVQAGQFKQGISPW